MERHSRKFTPLKESWLYRKWRFLGCNLVPRVLSPDSRKNIGYGWSRGMCVNKFRDGGRSSNWSSTKFCRLNDKILSGVGRKSVLQTGCLSFWVACKLRCFLQGTINRGAFCMRMCIRWTTIAWAYQGWWREIENSRKVTVLLKAISLVLWIPSFPTKSYHLPWQKSDVF